MLVKCCGDFPGGAVVRTCLPMPGTQVRALVREDPTCRGATKPMRHNYWACALEPVSHNYWARVPQYCSRKIRVCKSFLGTNENQKTDMASLLAFHSLPGFPLRRNPQDSPNLIYSFPETNKTGKGCQWEIQSCLLIFSPVPISVGKQSCWGCYHWWPWKQNNWHNGVKVINLMKL